MKREALNGIAIDINGIAIDTSTSNRGPHIGMRVRMGRGIRLVPPVLYRRSESSCVAGEDFLY